MEAQINKNIIKRLERVERIVENINEHMVDADTILTNEERLMLDESVKHEKNGELVSIEELEDVRSKNR